MESVRLVLYLNYKIDPEINSLLNSMLKNYIINMFLIKLVNTSENSMIAQAESGAYLG